MRQVQLLAVGLFSLFAVCLRAQVTPDMAKGLSSYAEYSASDIDNVNPVNGNVFLKLPLVSFPQRGGKLRLDYYIYYNDKQWKAPRFAPQWNNLDVYTSTWQLSSPYTITWGPQQSVGAYVARDQYAQYGTEYFNFSWPYNTGYQEFTINTAMTASAVYTSDGSTHYVGDTWSQSCTQIGGGAICPSLPNPSFFSESYPATDASGFDAIGHDSSGVLYTSQTNRPANISDPNGNAINATSTQLKDTFGRIIPGGMTGPGTTPFPSTSAGYGGDLVPGTNVTPDSNCPSGSSAERQ